MERSTVHGLDAMRAAVEARTGVVIVTGHLGNWEVGSACLAARGLEMDVVMQRQSNPLADAAINANRERLGIHPIDRRHAAKLGLRTLRQGRILGFASDQDARSGGIFVPFFGRPASTHRGPALLALRTGAPLFAATGLRAPDGRYDCRLQRIEVSREGDPDGAVARLTSAYTAVLEAAIRSAPEQYLWQHRRWKSVPPSDAGAAATMDGDA
jgi:KDO2-lipid IV(A) lauroyltransferase